MAEPLDPKADAARWRQGAIAQGFVALVCGVACAFFDGPNVGVVRFALGVVCLVMGAMAGYSLWRMRDAQARSH